MFVDKTFPIPAGCLDFRFLCRYEKELQPWLLIGVTLLVVVRAGGRVGADQDNLITDKTHLHVTQTRHVTKSIFNLRVGLVTIPHTCAKDSLIESWLWSSMKCSVFNIAYPTVDFTLFLNNLVMLHLRPLMVCVTPLRYRERWDTRHESISRAQSPAQRELRPPRLWRRGILLDFKT